MDSILIGILFLHPSGAFSALPRSSAKNGLKVGTSRLFEATRIDLENVNELTQLRLFSPSDDGNPRIVPTYRRRNTAKDIATMTAVGLAITLGAIYVLAASYSLTPASPMETNAVAEGQSIEMLYEHLVYVTLPEDSTDVFAIVIGESVGGLVGAACTTFAAAILRPAKTEEEKKALLVEALADSDYFMVRAIAQPLLTGRGLPNEPARIASVLLAIIPYEVLKLVSKRQQQLKEEDDRIMDELLLEQKMLNQGLFEDKPVIEPRKEDGFTLDVAEIFADIIKWLAYDVYRTDLGSTLHLLALKSGLTISMGMESAVFGCLAGLSYQLYLDAVHTFTEYGPEEKLMEVRSRNLSGWITLYGTECFAASVLFGVYETCKAPISVFVSDALSGGFDSCLGSSNMKICLDTFMHNNPPNPDFGEQARSLTTAFVSLWDRLWVDGAYDTQQFTHATTFQVCSLVNQMLTHLVDIL
jgi:hypothetical protein